jgi:hypothetical protein
MINNQEIVEKRERKYFKMISIIEGRAKIIDLRHKS